MSTTVTGERIAAELRKRKLSQAQLAVLLGVNRSRINDWISGHRNPRLPALKKMARVFKCKVSHLLGVS